MKTRRQRDSGSEKASALGAFRKFAFAFTACGLVHAVSLVAAPTAFAQGASVRVDQQGAPQTGQAQPRRARIAQQTRPAAPQPRQAAPKREPKGFIDTILEGPRLTTTPPEAADWVRQTRPDPNAPRGPATRSAPARPLLTPDEIRSREAALDAVRARHDRLAGRKPPSGKFGSAAGDRMPQAEMKPKPGCVLTCAGSIGVPQTQRR